MFELFNTVLYEPLLNLLMWLYNTIAFQDLGIAIIILTILIKAVLFYPSLKQMRAQRSLQDAQPAIEELKKKYADNKEELGKQIMQYYKNNKVNPFSSCLPLLVQLPILLALFEVFRAGVITTDTGLLKPEQVEHLYGYLKTTYMSTPISHISFGFLNLEKNHNILLAVAAGIMQFLQAKMLSTKKAPMRSAGSKDEDITAALNKQMLYIFPIMTVIFGYQFPAGLALYWFISTFITWLQQIYFLRLHAKSQEKKETA
ncbi:MAG: YidC/Oxa1 family membrane protein insertase [Candidatus Kerfeldbacteria bacterium]|nr:YidC/Oxa1 family membrane protein insertase [Candidatus Kerfeldbacteria bacterium]